MGPSYFHIFRSGPHSHTHRSDPTYIYKRCVPVVNIQVGHYSILKANFYHKRAPHVYICYTILPALFERRYSAFEVTCTIGYSASTPDHAPKDWDYIRGYSDTWIFSAYSLRIDFVVSSHGLASYILHEQWKRPPSIQHAPCTPFSKPCPNPALTRATVPFSPAKFYHAELNCFTNRGTYE